MTTRRAFVQQTATLAGLGLPLAGLAQTTSDTARILVGFPPGGSTDILARRIADKLRGQYAPNVVVDNKPGTGGGTAVTLLRDSPADGSTLMVTPSSILSIYPFTYPKLPYKPLEDVQPVSMACSLNHAFGVGPAVPVSVKTFRDFLAWARANPDKANYGSPAPGSMPHMIAALAFILSGVPMKHIPYRGAAPGIQDLLAGKISAMSSPIGDYLPHYKSGALRVLAISGINRSPFVPDVPTYRQQGLPITVREWYGVFLPGKASPSTTRRAAAYLQTALAQPDLIASMAQIGIEVQSSSPQALTDLMKADTDEWRRLIKQIGFTAES